MLSTTTDAVHSNEEQLPYLPVHETLDTSLICELPTDNALVHEEYKDSECKSVEYDTLQTENSFSQLNSPTSDDQGEETPAETGLYSSPLSLTHSSHLHLSPDTESPQSVTSTEQPPDGDS